MVGRIETYTHSDSITQNKGAAVVKVECDTDFAARTPGFMAFAQTVAKYAYGAGATTWEGLIDVFPDLEVLRVDLAKELKEKIRVSEIIIVTL